MNPDGVKEHLLNNQEKLTPATQGGISLSDKEIIEKLARLEEGQTRKEPKMAEVLKSLGML